MKSRPVRLDWYAFFLTLIALSIPAQIMIIHGHSPAELPQVAAKLAPLNWLILIFAPFTAWLIHRASRLTFLAVPALAGLVIYNNWLVAEMGTDYSPAWVALATLGFLFSLASLFNRDMLGLLGEPGLRWWLTPERRRAAVPVRIQVLGHNYKAQARTLRAPLSSEFYARTYDLSETGAFIPISIPHTAVDYRALTPGSQCTLSIGLAGVTLLRCRAEIVRAVAPRGDYPAGVGIRFIGLGWNQGRKLKRFLTELPAAEG